MIRNAASAAGGRPNLLPGMMRLVLALICCTEILQAAPGPAIQPGVAVRFQSRRPGRKSSEEWAALERLALFVGGGTSPSPFLPPGPFVAEVTGFITTDLRINCSFQAEFRGRLRLEVNGAPVLEGEGDDMRCESPQTVRLAKGTNAVRLAFASLDDGDAFFRVNWSSREFHSEPVEAGVLSHAPTEELRLGALLRHGREVFLRDQCAQCHLPGLDRRGNPVLERHAPRLDGIGSRRRADWLAAWIHNPGAHRSSTQMPAVFSGPAAASQARSVAAYLVTLKDPGRIEANPDTSPESIESGRLLYEKLHCAACHALSDGKEVGDPGLSLAGLGHKYTPPELATFLQRPQEDYPLTRMPDFQLGVREAGDLAAYLMSVGQAPPPPRLDEGQLRVEEGRELVRLSGCLNCHPGPGENGFSTVAATSFDADAWARGCMADDGVNTGAAPRFRLIAAEREALRAFGRAGLGSLGHRTPWEFASHHTASLNCRGCHGRIDGVPRTEVLGGKLRPEWTRRLLAGDLPYKPRPWIDPRMPAFPGWAAELAEGLAAGHGFPAVTAQPPLGEPGDVEVGRRLVSANGGFSCVACHAVGAYDIVQAPDGRGVNLVHASSRLLKPYFERWLRNPLRIDAATKMPVYFEGDRSPLVEHFEGDAARQIAAIWCYLQLGDRMPAPAGAPGP